MSFSIDPKSIAFAFDDSGVKLVAVGWVTLVLLMALFK